MDKLTPHLQLLIATAWSDGKLDPSETAYLEQILTSCGLSQAETRAALQAGPVALESVLEKFPPDQPRDAIMRDVLRVVFCDGVLEAEEYDLVERMAQRLEIDEATLDRLRQTVSEE